MYTSCLYDPGSSFDIRVRKKIEEMVDVYVFADKRGIPGLKNAIVDLLIEAQIEAQLVPGHAIPKVWNALPESDGLRSLFFDWMSMKLLDVEKFFSDERLEWYPPNFMLKLLRCIAHPEKRPAIRKDRQWLAMKCRYHDHTGAEVGGNQALRNH
jgi:hypothetical protein